MSGETTLSDGAQGEDIEKPQEVKQVVPERALSDKLIAGVMEGKDAGLLLAELSGTKQAFEQKADENLEQLAADEHGSAHSQEIDSAEAEVIARKYQEVSVKAKVFNRSMDILRKLQKPENTAAVAAAMVGIVGWILKDPELARLSMIGGFTIAGAVKGRNKGIPGMVAGGVGGGVVAVGAGMGSEQIPFDGMTKDVVMGVVDDAPNLAKIVGALATVAATKMGNK